MVGIQKQMIERMKRTRGSSWGPALVVLILSAILVGTYIYILGDPLALARLGTRFSEGDPNGTEGYDGQFVYYIALNPSPKIAATRLDEPAYRYQRILLPLAARALALGRAEWIPVTIPLINIFSLAAGTAAVGALLVAWKVSSWYALIYGLWAGFTLSLAVDLPEPLAYGLIMGGVLALERSRRLPGWICFGLAAFARETTILFPLAAAAVYLIRRDWRGLAGIGLVSLLPFVIFQLWLWSVFGRPGIGSGGAMATPFEIIPFMGLLRIGHYSSIYLAAMLVVFGPAVVLPSIWGVMASVRLWFAREYTLPVAALFFNAAVIAFTPFSTFRETGGLIRFATGLVVALILFAARYNRRRVLNYSILLFVLNVFLVK